MNRLILFFPMFPFDPPPPPPKKKKEKKKTKGFLMFSGRSKGNTERKRVNNENQLTGFYHDRNTDLKLV